MNVKELQAKLEALEAENARLKQRNQRKVGFKVSEKGCVTMTGVRRFGASFYINEWETIIANISKLQAFIEENRAELESRADATREAKQSNPVTILRKAN